MGRILGAALVPSAPFVIPEVAPELPAAHRDDVTELREAAARAVASLPAADAVVLVARGTRGIHLQACVDLRGLGSPGVVREHPVAVSLLPDLTSRTQYAQRHGDDLDVDLAALALQLPAATTVVPVAVATADGASLAATGRAIADTIAKSARQVTLLCAADLSAALTEHSPRYRVEGASEWDAATVEALRAGDLPALREQGADAQRVHARSWAPLVVGMAAARAAGLHPSEIGYRTARGVGYAVGDLVG